MDEILSLDKETSQPPKSRIADAASARTIVVTFKQAEDLRAIKRAKIQGMLDGNRPYNQKALANKGQGVRTNLNLREAEGMADAAKTPYYDIVFENEHFIRVQFDYANDAGLNLTWSNVANEELKRLLDDWDGFDKNTQLKQWQMCVFGVGIPMWEHSLNWKWKGRKASDVLVPDDAEADIDELETAVIPRSYLPGDLFKLIENEAAAKVAGWNVPVARRAIINAAEDKVRTQFGHNWEFYQNAIRNGDVSWNTTSKRISIADVLQKEFSGKVSRYMVLDDNVDQSGAEEQFLFKKIDCYDSMSQVLCPFFFDIGTGDWHSVKGLGPKIFDFCEVSNRMAGDMIDGARRAAKLLLQASDATAVQKFQTVDMADATVYGPEFTVQQNRLGENMQGVMIVRRELQNVLQSNTGQYRERISAENQEPTLGQAQLNAANQARLGKSAINRYCKSLDRLYREMVRRILNPAILKKDSNGNRPPGGDEAYEFIQRCTERGIPKEALKMEYLCSIKAMRPVGHGSEQMRMVLADKLISMIPMITNERSRNAALRYIAATYFNQYVADVLFPPYDTPQIIDEHLGLATLENNALRAEGGQVAVTPAQDDATHFVTHFTDVNEHVQELQQGQANPISVLVHMQNAIPHLQEHLSKIAGDPTREVQVKQFAQGLAMLVNGKDQLQQQIEEAMKAQADAQPKVDPALAAAMAKVNGELEIKRTKMIGDMQLKADKQKATLAMKDWDTAHRMKLKSLEASATIPPVVVAEMGAGAKSEGRIQNAEGAAA